jgi:hypothetical protein
MPMNSAPRLFQAMMQHHLVGERSHRHRQNDRSRGDP